MLSLLFVLLPYLCAAISPDIREFVRTHSGPRELGHFVSPPATPNDNNGILGDDTVPANLLNKPLLQGIPAPQLARAKYPDPPAQLPQFGVLDRSFAKEFADQLDDFKATLADFKKSLQNNGFKPPQVLPNGESFDAVTSNLKDIWSEGEGLYLDEFKDLAQNGAKEAIGSVLEESANGTPVGFILESIEDHIGKSLEQNGVTDIAKYAATAAFLTNPFTSAIGTAALADQVYEKARGTLKKIPVVKEIIKPVEKVRNFVKDKITDPIDKAAKPVEKFTKKVWNKGKSFVKKLFG